MPTDSGNLLNWPVLIPVTGAILAVSCGGLLPELHCTHLYGIKFLACPIFDHFIPE
jgi:hypothetical protein